MSVQQWLLRNMYSTRRSMYTKHIWADEISIATSAVASTAALYQLENLPYIEQIELFGELYISYMRRTRAHITRCTAHNTCSRVDDGRRLVSVFGCAARTGAWRTVPSLRSKLVICRHIQLYGAHCTTCDTRRWLVKPLFYALIEDYNQFKIYPLQQF